MSVERRRELSRCAPSRRRRRLRAASPPQPPPPRKPEGDAHYGISTAKDYRPIPYAPRRIPVPPQFTGKNTFFGKTAAMLQQGGNELGHLQKILLKIMFVLVVTSFVLCITAFGYLLGKGEVFKEALSFTVVLLVASIPIAIEIVCTTTLALGSRQLSAHGAIVTRLAAIEDMAGMNMLCSDKTGTLTLNKMAIQVGVVGGGVSCERVLCVDDWGPGSIV